MKKGVCSYSSHFLILLKDYVPSDCPVLCSMEIGGPGMAGGIDHLCFQNEMFFFFPLIHQYWFMFNLTLLLFSFHYMSVTILLSLANTRVNLMQKPYLSSYIPVDTDLYCSS